MIRDTAERLLRGEFVCSTSAPEAYRDLEEPETRARVEAILAPLNRKISVTANRAAYYATWINLDLSEDRASIRREFQSIMEQLRPVLEFILLVMDASTRDHPMMPGSQVTEAELTARVQNNQYLTTRAKKIGTLLNKRPQIEVPEIIRNIIDRMVKFEILRENLPGTRIFTFTGKVDYIYEVLEFIDAHENILAEEEAAMEQQKQEPFEEDLFSS